MDRKSNDFALLFIISSMKIEIHVEFCLYGEELNPDDLTKHLVIGCLAPSMVQL
jgi:hypothetical protein